MAATIEFGSLSLPITTASDFADKIVAQMPLTGITELVSSYEESAGRYAYRVMRFTTNTTKNKGVIYWRLRVDDFSATQYLVSQQLVTGWDDATKTHDLQTYVLGADYTIFIKGRSVYFFAINEPQIRNLILYHERGLWINRIYLGYIRPFNLPPGWWDENSYPYCFCSVNGSFNTFRFFNNAGSPVNTISTFFIPESTDVVQLRNFVNNKISMWTNVPLTMYNNYGVVQQFDNNVVYFAQNGHIELGYYLRDQENDETYFVMAEEHSNKIAVKVNKEE